MTEAATRPRRRSGWQQVGYLAKRVTLAEVRSYQSIYRFTFRRPKVPPGATGFTYHQPILGMLITFIVVSTIEVVVVDLIVRRWPYVRIAVLILGIWGVVWMLGMLFGMLTRPHAVGPQGLRLRYGSEIDVPLAWEDVDTVTRRRRPRPDKEPKVTLDDRGDATLHLRIADETNIEVELTRPTLVRLPHGTERLSRIFCHLDDPDGFVTEVRRHLR